jgi:integrase
MSTINYPKVCLTRDKKVFISFHIKDKRYRLFNGKRIGSNLEPNTFPFNQRIAIGNLLAAEIYEHLSKGGALTKYRSGELATGTLSDIEYLRKALQNKQKGNLSTKYKQTLKFVYDSLLKEIKGDSISSLQIQQFLSRYSSETSFNTLRRHLNALLNEAVTLGMKSNPMSNIKSLNGKAKLNKPFDNVAEVLNEIKLFNQNLYLCSLLTYGCLLRPHREIRELTWGEISNDMAYIKLDGKRNKSGRNRIVPIPSYVRENLSKKDKDLNIFTGTNTAPNKDYFKTLWGRFKKASKLLGKDQTLYSFRHSGAIEIYKRTGSLSKLQKALGHSSLTVSLTYLRGLEVAELVEVDMPELIN